MATERDLDILKVKEDKKKKQIEKPNKLKVKLMKMAKNIINKKKKN